MTTEHPLKPRVATASPEDRPILERLWLMFRHDMSKYSGVLPNRDGGFRQERLDAALRGDVGWGAFLFQFGESPIGLAVVRALADSPHVISSFFLVHGARRRRLGTAAVQRIVEEFPGREHSGGGVLAESRECDGCDLG